VHANTVHGSDEFEPVPRADWPADLANLPA